MRALIVAGMLVVLPSGTSPGAQAPAPARTPDIYFAATRQAVVEQMLQLADVRAGDMVFDLGSGDGRIVILAAQRYMARGVGVEIDPKLVDLAREVARDGDVADQVEFRQGDLFQTDLSTADVVTLYLSPTINSELEPKLRRELKSGARIVSHQFPIGRWPPNRTVRGADDTDLYLWVIP